MSKIIYRNLILISLLALSGCAGNVGVTSRGCKASQAQIASEEDVFKADFKWDKKVWSGGSSVNLIRIKSYLQEKEIDCTKVARVRYEVAQTFWDQLFSIFPFFSRMTIRIEVQKV